MKLVNFFAEFAKIHANLLQKTRLCCVVDCFGVFNALQ